MVGMDSSNTSVLHSAGEVVFSFPTYGGNVRLCPIGDALTPFGGLVPWAAFQKRSGLLEALAATCLRRFMASVPEAEGVAWVAAAAQRLWGALPDKLILDWDSTVQTKYGHQEGAAVGYNPQKRGRRSFHPLLAVAAGSRLCPYYRFRRGDPETASQWEGAISDRDSIEPVRWLTPPDPWNQDGPFRLKTRPRFRAPP
jgi:hypothetical protein